MLGLGYTGYFVALLGFPVLSVITVAFCLHGFISFFANFSHPGKKYYYLGQGIACLIITVLFISHFYEAYTYRW